MLIWFFVFFLSIQLFGCIKPHIYLLNLFLLLQGLLHRISGRVPSMRPLISPIIDFSNILIKVILAIFMRQFIIDFRVFIILIRLQGLVLNIKNTHVCNCKSLFLILWNLADSIRGLFWYSSWFGYRTILLLFV